MLCALLPVRGNSVESRLGLRGGDRRRSLMGARKSLTTGVVNIQECPLAPPVSCLTAEQRVQFSLGSTFSDPLDDDEYLDVWAPVTCRLSGISNESNDTRPDVEIECQFYNPCLAEAAGFDVRRDCHNDDCLVDAGGLCPNNQDDDDDDASVFQRTVKCARISEGSTNVDDSKECVFSNACLAQYAGYDPDAECETSTVLEEDEVE